MTLLAVNIFLQLAPHNFSLLFWCLNIAREKKAMHDILLLFFKAVPSYWLRGGASKVEPTCWRDIYVLCENMATEICSSRSGLFGLYNKFWQCFGTKACIFSSRIMQYCIAFFSLHVVWFYSMLASKMFVIETRNYILYQVKSSVHFNRTGMR